MFSIFLWVFDLIFHRSLTWMPLKENEKYYSCRDSVKNYGTNNESESGKIWRYRTFLKKSSSLIQCVTIGFALTVLHSK